MQCDAPQCADVKDRCQCPNSWLEFLAHEAASRRKNSLPRLSMRSHALKYKKLKKAGKFRKAANIGVCNNINTNLLCAWNKERKRTSDMPARIDPSSLKNFMTLTDPSICDFPKEPRIKSGLIDGVPVIIKVENLNNPQNNRKFLYTTKIHLLMAAKIPRSVPKLFAAYLLKDGAKTSGVHIMERIEGITMEEYFQSRSPDWKGLARAVKRIIDDLASCSILHVDLNPSNIMVTRDSSGKIRNAKAIDFESTWLVNKDPIENVYGMLSIDAIPDDKSRKALITAYLKLDTDLPRNMADWEMDDFYEITEADRPVRQYTNLPKLPTIIS